MSNTSQFRKQEADRRRARLAELIRLHFDDKHANFIKRTGINQGELSGLLNEKSFGGVKARNIEEQAGLIPKCLEWDLGAPFFPDEIREDGAPVLPPAARSAGNAFSLRPSAQALVNAIEDADRRGITDRAFDLLRETLQLFGDGQATDPHGTLDLDHPPP